MCYNLSVVVVGGVDNPVRTGVAPHVLILDELNPPPGAFSGPAGGLKTHHTPLSVSRDKSIKMPALAPNAQKLCVDNIILVTQELATTKFHRDAALEVARVFDIAKKTGDRADEARDFLVNLRRELLASGDQIIINPTHSFIPEGY